MISLGKELGDTIERTGNSCATLIEIQELSSIPLGDIGVFEREYKKHIAEGNWKPRNEEEYDNALFYHMLFLDSDVVIGGASIIPQEDDGYMISCLWTQEQSKGYGKRIVHKISLLYAKGTLYAYSKNGDFFEKNGFRKIIGAVSPTGALLYKKDPL